MTAARAPYTSSRDKLLELASEGPFFEGRLARLKFNWDSKTASHYLWRWADRDLVKPLGGKSDLYFNLVAFPGSGHDLEPAIQRVMPGAIVGGDAVLHDAGISTQRVTKLPILVRPDERAFAISDAMIERRPVAWWRTTDAFPRAFVPAAEYRLCRLSVAAAIADSATSGTGLAPDDLYFDEVRTSDGKSAIKLIGLLTGESWLELDLAKAYRRVWEARQAAPPA